MVAQVVVRPCWRSATSANGSNDDKADNSSSIAIAMGTTAVYPELTIKMAMKIGGKYEPEEVYVRHWHRFVPDTAVARNAIDKNLADMAAKTLDQGTKLHNELKKDGITSPVLHSILALIKKRSARLKQ